MTEDTGGNNKWERQDSRMGETYLETAGAGEGERPGF